MSSLARSAEFTLPTARPRAGGVIALLLGLALALAGSAVLQLGQGTADVGLADIWRLLSGGEASGQTADVVLASRLPRLAAGLLVGVALGVAGCTLQALSRNPLASPDTLAVNAGAHLALTAVAAFGINLGVLSGTAVAFVGGLAAAAAVLALTGSDSSPARLILVGSVFSLALAGITSGLLLIFSQETTGLFAWGSGTLSQAGPDGTVSSAWAIGLALLLVGTLSGRLDLLQLGDDAARSLGLSVPATRAALVGGAVLLAAASVSLAGPIGFVGLCAPAAVRLLVGRIPRLASHAWLLPASALAGAVMVVLADVLLRWVLGAADAVEVPTGVVTTLLGAAVLVAVALALRTDSSRETGSTMIGSAAGLTRRLPWLTIGVVALLTLIAAAAALLFGDGFLRLGDLSNWLNGVASGRISFMFGARLPRAAAALLAGACLALAGTLTQATARNSLADPGILGVAAGAGVGAMSALVAFPESGWSGMSIGALIGALVSGALVFGLAARSGFDPTRLVLIGIGVQAGASALITVLVVRSDPWNQSKAITWLGGSSYGASLPRLVWVAIALLIGAAVAWWLHRDLDVVQLDAETPVLLGLPVSAVRVLALTVAMALTAAATSGVGVIGFVGLVAPHAARMLVGSAHRALVPLATLLGALMVLVADTVGRTVIAPAQLPVGIVCALVGAPYFLWLMARMRAH